METENNGGNDAKLFGFVTHLAQRGVFKLFIGMLITIILLQQGYIAWILSVNTINSQTYVKNMSDVQKTANEQQNKTTEVLMQLITELSKTKKNVDTTFSK